MAYNLNSKYHNHYYKEEKVSDMIFIVTTVKLIKIKINPQSSKNKSNQTTSENEAHDNNITSPVQKPSRKKYIDAKLKLQCLEMLNNGFTRDQCYKYLKIPMRYIKLWTKQGPFKKNGSGRRIVDPNMERMLLEWYSVQIDDGKLPTAELMREKALEFCSVKTFRASQGWLQKFRIKYNLLLDDKVKYKN
jgi:hypothetical protein